MRSAARDRAGRKFHDTGSGTFLAQLLGMRDHRKLLIWQRAHTLTIEVRRAARTFPRSGYTSIRTQMTRAAESLVLTIEEGCGSNSQREFARFLDMSLKSSTELEEELELAKDYGVLQHKLWRPCGASSSRSGA